MYKFSLLLYDISDNCMLIWMSRLSSGVESILEGLFGPELVEDLKLFKGKNLFSWSL